MGNIADYLCSDARIKKENFGKLEHLLRHMCLDPKQNVHLGRTVCEKVIFELDKKDGQHWPVVQISVQTANGAVREATVDA